MQKGGILHCYIAGNFFPTGHILIGYLEVTRHLTMKLFPAKISELETIAKSLISAGNTALLPVSVDCLRDLFS